MKIFIVLFIIATIFYVFGKKNYLDSQKKTIFNNIKFLYFYKISREFLGTDSKPFTLPKSIRISPDQTKNRFKYLKQK